MLSLLVALAGRSALGQQCPPVVPLGAGALGADNTVAAMTEWDPDGTGPLGPRVVLGGSFATAGDVLSPGIAAFDPATGQWSGFGAGGAEVRALLALPNGQLLAAGDFTATLGQAGARLALWNGTAWQVLGSGVDGQVLAMARLQNGELVVGGRFTTAGGVPCANIARWNGTTWSSLGAGVTGAFGLSVPVKAMTVDPAGTLWVGGDFASAGGVPCANVARWNGSTWSPVGPGLTSSVTNLTIVRGVTGLGVLPSGEVAAIGAFDTSGTFSLGGAARWNGAFWQAIGTGIGSLSPFGSLASMRPYSAAFAPNGEIAVVGDLLAAAGSNVRRMLRWNLSQWVALPSSTELAAYPLCALFAGGRLMIGGYFQQLGTPPVRIDHVARLAGASWQPLPSPSVGVSCDETLLGFGDYLGQPVATGRIGFVGNQPANGLIVRQGGTWQPFPGAPATMSGYVVTSLGNGELVVGGGFFDLGGTSVAGLVRYDGSTWSPFPGFGAAWFGSVRSLLRLRDGSLVVGGSFETVGGVPCNGIARWDGVAWSSFGTGVDGAVLTLLELPNGELVAAGNFQVAGGVPCNRVARWNGSTWSPYGAGVGGFGDEVYHAVLDGSGALVVAGSFPSSLQALGHVARWDGANWSLLAGGVSVPVTGLAALPGGDVLVAVADYYAATTSPGLLRTDGTTWTPFAVQPDGGKVLSMHLRPDGELLLRGSFGGVRSSKFASVLPSCPALATPIGNGCAGSNGQDTLTSVALPWLGSVARAEATGLPAEAWVVVVLGVTSANVPLTALTPLALPGCDVRTSIDFYVLANVTGGFAPIDLPLPLQPALVGASLFEQVLSLGLTSGAPFEATSTNALELQLGLFGG
ncbi:MAG: hypothetical protein JNL12_22515 [Planctomycetes bacterium]|nr:hypothetical protein [Planctomycetota bacterium]